MPMTAGRAVLAVAVAALAACDASPFRTVAVKTNTPAPRSHASSDAGPTLRFSVAAIESPRDTFTSYTHLFERVGKLLGTKVTFEQRRTYREVNDLLIGGALDAALVCTGGYLDLERRAPGAVEVVAVPVVQGGESYRSVVIVPATSDARAVADLRGRSIAFTDELSYSGRLHLLRVVRGLGAVPDEFFGAVTYTGSHDRSIQAVASGIVDGAAVHGGVLAWMEKADPALARRIRVIYTSPPMGAMPVVVSKRVPPEQRERLREALLGLEDDPEGGRILGSLHFDRFAVPRPGLYASAVKDLEGP